MPPLTAPSNALYDRILTQYFAGDWDELNAQLTANIREVSTLPPAQKADIDYIRKTIAECRPAWWKIIKAGARSNSAPSSGAIPSPQAGNKAPASRTWASTMLGRTRLLRSIGTQRTWTTPRWSAKWNSPRAKRWMKPSGRVGKGCKLGGNRPALAAWLERRGPNALSRYLEFRSYVTSAYYTAPAPADGLCGNPSPAGSHEYDKDANQMVRKTVAILFNEEVLAHPEIYKTVPRPKEPPADGAESKMVWELQEWMRPDELSLAEEKSFRDALKNFATANELKVRTTGRVMLPNGLAVSLDPAADKPLAAHAMRGSKAFTRRSRRLEISIRRLRTREM